MRSQRTITRTLLCGLAAALVATCAAAAGPASAAPQGFVTAGLDRAGTPPGAPVPAVVDGLTHFGYRLGRSQAATTTNWVISPLSVAYLFGMARAGAAGDTAATIDRVFDFPTAGTHEAFNALDRQLAPPGGPLAAANALWAQPGLPIGEPFLRTLATQYGTGVRTVDFGSPDAKKAIDAWVREETRGRIQQLFDQLEPETRAVLANAIYFKGEWVTPFRGSDPDATFTRPDGSTVRTSLMREPLTVSYAQGPGWQAVELPYAGAYAMWVLLPDPSGAPVDLLAPDVLAAVRAGLRPELVDVSLPKWEFGTEVDLLAALADLGAGDLRDFSGINPSLVPAQAVHRANITVDEKGTEAAAVSGIATVVSARPMPRFTFRADRPFAFAIMHTPTHTPAFIGTVADPTA